MILYLATTRKRTLAWLMFVVFYLSNLTSVLAYTGRRIVNTNAYYYNPSKSVVNVKDKSVSPAITSVTRVGNNTLSNIMAPSIADIKKVQYIGGPTQPEMATFKSVGTDNMVNLFTGDFNYNIPLLDVGGYPVNIFYDGSITPEQEASWVGLGWNINPGTVTRNMRGVPDDFDGTDMLVQRQSMKPNKTFGVNVAADIEVMGIKELASDVFQSAGLGINLGANLGVSFNNYLGPALDLGVKGGTSFTLASKSGSEKDAKAKGLSLGVGLGANASSRYGFTLSPNVSLNASLQSKDRTFSNGIGMSTSYNSRSGMRSLQLYDQVSLSKKETKYNWSEKEGHMLDIFDRSHKYGSAGMSASISFVKPSYVPALRMPITNKSWAGHFQLGGSIFGLEGDVDAEVSMQESFIDNRDSKQTKPMVGFLYYEKANSNSVMDFTRLGDKEVTPNTPIISAPQYTYDVFSISGEGTGGSVRAYRNDLGYVRDNYTQTKDDSWSVGVDVGIPGQYGANFNTIKTPSSIGEWNNGNKLRGAIPFVAKNGIWENVYFRNPGESSVLNSNQFNRVGGTDLVRFKLGGSNQSPTIEPKLEKIAKDGSGAILSYVDIPSTVDPAERKKRTQVISFLTAEEASQIGLDKKIKSYKTEAATLLTTSKYLSFDPIERFSIATGSSDYRKKHHISQINVTESDGMRYVYGIPVYNTIQKDFTFSVKKDNAIDQDQDRVNFSRNEMSENSELLLPGAYEDGYIQITETPAYAHSFLLSGLLSPDYIDVTDNGITEDDLGNAVKFNYSKINANFKWRTPHSSVEASIDGTTANGVANYNPGNKTVNKDNKGLITYGERESWYMHSIESKTMIAIFTLVNRNDGKGASSEFGGITDNNALKALDKIDLYNKADLKAHNIRNVKPIKTVHFVYDYLLCKETPDNLTGGGGKLTLTKIYFTFNGQERNNKNQYVFNYGDVDDILDNPNYTANASDRWGNYKPNSSNPGSLKNSEYPYAAQTTNVAPTTIDKNASAWSLKKVLLPSGGQIEVNYESDDYAFVQNKRAAAMMSIAGFTSNLTIAPTNKLYDFYGIGVSENRYVFLNVNDPCSTKDQVQSKYLQGLSQIAFRLTVNMPKGEETMTAYAEIEDYGIVNNNTIWVKIKDVDGISPLSLVAIEYLREQLPGQAYPGYDVSSSSGLKQVGEMLLGMLDGLSSAFKKPLEHLRSQGLARSITLAKSFARLNVPNGFKKGGGNRVKSVKLRDNWDRMTGQFASEYGQTYDYKTTETLNGVERPISSGVASYEPSIGGEENPFQTIVLVGNSVPLGPTSYGSVEMPILDGLFPAPLVGYSKVIVRSLRNSTIPNDKKTRSGVGKQVTEFYTAKDFPVKYSHTPLDAASVKEVHQSSLLAFFYKYAFDSKALSQGFLLELNDMHGKMKSQASYSENDEQTPVNFTQNFYRNTGVRGFDEKFTFVTASQGGAVSQGNMGIDVELMTDAREFQVKSNSLEIQAQIDLFPIIIPIWIPFVWPVVTNSENTYRAVTTTKVINYHSVVDKVVVMDKGSMVSTENQVFDAETGQVVVNKTNNEFNKPIYSTTYPAYWAYSGMGLAYKNIDATFSNVNFYDGNLVSGIDNPNSIFESGDEIYITGGDIPTSDCGAKLASLNDADVNMLWAFDKDKNTSSLTNPTPHFIFIDKYGKPYTKNNVTIRIVRSGKRNMLGSPLAAITSMSSPIVGDKLAPDESSNVINGSASEYKEKWQTDNDVIFKLATLLNNTTCTVKEVIDCNGYIEKGINPYRKSLFGNFRPHRSMVFYDARRETNPTGNTNITQYGVLKEFVPYWNFNNINNLVTSTNSKWVWNSKMNKANAKGMELESNDALGIYTSAQYGYHKTLPVAITNNAKYNEMFFEGFEDKAYDENITGTLTSCDNNHVNLSGLANSTIENTDNLSFNAHTGKYVLSVNANSSATQTIPVADALANDYNVTHTTSETVFPVGTATPGSNLVSVSSPVVGTGRPYPTYVANSNTMEMHVSQPADRSPAPNRGANNVYEIITQQYINVVNGGNYQLRQNVWSNFIHGLNSPHLLVHVESIKILNDQGQVVRFLDYSDAWPGDAYWGYTFENTVCLLKGVYSVEVKVVRTGLELGPGDRDCVDNPHANHSNICDVVRVWFTTSLPGYQSVTPLTCNTTKPAPVANNMYNGTFSVPPNKKMLFSTWVKEICGTPSHGQPPCSATQFNNNTVTLSFNASGSSTITLTPTGNIIEGWQRYEGAFAAPTGATTMTIKFNNTSNGQVYFDDIRMHPFNANMKSYVYNPTNLRLTAELDANNYASFYEYDEEGTLIRTKAETKEGIKTIKETRSAKQKKIVNFQ